MTTFEADWVCPISSPPIRNGAIAVENGRLAQVPMTGERVRFPGCAIIPGFVNAHAHLELTILRGFLDDLPFAAWIPKLTRAKYQQLSRDDMLVSARLGAIEMLHAGVTCVGEVMDLGTAWQAMREFGLQGVAYQEVFGPADSQVEVSMPALQKKIEEYRRDETETFRAGVSPHAPYTVSSRLYRAVSEYAAREGLRLTTHAAESLEEGLFVRQGAGIFAERLRQRGIPVSAKGRSPIAYLDELGLLRAETLLVHAIDVSDTDIETIREKRSPVVHCPKSNAKLAHGIAPMSEFKDAGVTLGLGTDSVASNNVIDMFEEMRAAVFQQRVRTGRLESLDAQTVFRMATLGAAECLGLAEHLGSLAAGKRADFVVVDLNDAALQPVYDPIEAMVYSASRHNIRATYIGGREVNPDPDDVIDAARTAAMKLA